MMHEWYPSGSKLYDVVAELANFLNEGKPVEVVVINNHNEVNAWCILGKKGKPPIIVFTSGLIKTFPYREQIAGVLGHELFHASQNPMDRRGLGI